jgi:hypothetical protein
LIHLQAEMLANLPDDGGADDDPVFTLCGNAPPPQPSAASVDPPWQAYSNSVQAAVTDCKLTHVHMHPSSRSAAFPGMAWCLPAFNPKGVSDTEQPAVCTDACHSCSQQYFSRYFFLLFDFVSVRVLSVRRSGRVKGERAKSLRRPGRRVTSPWASQKARALYRRPRRGGNT